MPKKILVISPTPSHPQSAGNRARIFSLIKNMQSMGHDVYFLFLTREHGDIEAMRRCWAEKFFLIPYKRPANRFGYFMRRLKKRFWRESAYTYKIDEWYDPGLDSFLDEILNQIHFDVVMVEYVFFSRALLRCKPEILKIIDTNDVFTNRHKKYLQQSQPPAWYSTSKREEAKGLNRADIVMAIQNCEADYFRSITNKKVITIGHVVPLCQLPVNEAVLYRILYIGSDNDINVQAARYIVDEILPLVRESIPQLELLLAGRICNVIADQEGIILMGEIDELKQAYESASLVVNPVRFGTGLKIKTIEALGYGKPLITTSVGAEGLEEGRGSAFIVENNACDFAYSVTRLLNNPEALNGLSEKAYQFAENWNKKCLKELGEMLKSG